MQPTNRPRPTGSGSEAARQLFSLANVSSQGSGLPNRYGFYAGSGFGKTSMLAYAPKPIFIETRGETGLETLIDSGQIPNTPHFPEAKTWLELLDYIRALREQDHDYKTLVLDVANGAERLMHEHVCERDFGGDWGERGFGSYQKGYDVSLADWRMFLNDVDRLREEKKMTIFFLFHAKIKPFKNPTGPDFDRYVPECSDKTWTLTKGWLDCILFGYNEILVHTAKKASEEATKKGKAADTAARIICTDSTNPVYDAKNRLGLPAEIECGESAKEAWGNLAKAIIAGRKQNGAS